MFRIARLCFVLLGIAWSSCSLPERTDRFLEGTEPDEPLPTVPRPPEELAAPLSPRVVLLALPGLSRSLVERGMREEWLPVLRRLRTDATWGPLAPGDAGSPPAAGLSILRGVERAVAAPFQVVEDAASSLFGGDVPPGYPDLLPRVAPPDSHPSLLDAVAQGGKVAFVLRWPVARVPRSDAILDLGAGGLPDLAFGPAGYTLVRETRGEPRREPNERGQVLYVRRTTGGRAFDVFRFEVEGPPDGGGGSPRLAARIEVFAPPERTRARVVSSDGEVEVRAGFWSEPLPLRFQFSSGAFVFGRTRVYLRPTGLPEMELFVEPPEFDPLRPPSWQSVSHPRDLAASLEREWGPLPRFSGWSAASALLDGVLDPRDAAAALEFDHTGRRRVFEEALAYADHDLLIDWMDLAERTAALVARTRDRDREIEMFGRRLRWSRAPEAAAVALDEIIGAVVTAVSAEPRPGALTLVVVAPYGMTADGRPDAAEGWWATTRLAAGEERAPDLPDIAPTVAAMLGVSPPAGATGVAWRAGPPMEPLPEVVLTREVVPDEDEDDEDDGSDDP